MAKEKSKFNLKDQLAGVAALVAAIVAIGGGFVKYGEITTIGKNDNPIAVLKTEVELLNLMIKEMKAKADNPLQ